MKYILTAFIIIFLASCKILWVPASVPAIINLKIAAKTSDSSFVAGLASYDAAEYAGIMSNDKAIFAQDSARKKSGVLLIQDAQIINVLTALEAQHKQYGTLSGGLKKVYVDMINNAWAADIVSEKSY